MTGRPLMAVKLPMISLSLIMHRPLLCSTKLTMKHLAVRTQSLQSLLPLIVCSTSEKLCLLVSKPLPIGFTPETYRQVCPKGRLVAPLRCLNLMSLNLTALTEMSFKAQQVRLTQLNSTSKKRNRNTRA